MCIRDTRPRDHRHTIQRYNRGTRCDSEELCLGHIETAYMQMICSTKIVPLLQVLQLVKNALISANLCIQTSKYLNHRNIPLYSTNKLDGPVGMECVVLVALRKDTACTRHFPMVLPIPRVLVSPYTQVPSDAWDHQRKTSNHRCPKHSAPLREVPAYIPKRP